MAEVESGLGVLGVHCSVHGQPRRAPGALVELAQELRQLISGLRKPSVVCHFFHPLFFSEFRPLPSQ